MNAPDEHDGILIYTFETNNFERITEFGLRPIWLRDSRRLLFRDAGKLFLVNSETKKVQEISLHSPNPVIEYGLTADNRTLYYTLLSTEADIWLVDLGVTREVLERNLKLQLQKLQGLANRGTFAGTVSRNLTEFLRSAVTCFSTSSGVSADFAS